MELKFRCDEVVLTINEENLNKLNLYRQLHDGILESGGLLMGRTDIKGNTRIIDITKPQEHDIQRRIFFVRRDFEHKRLLTIANEKCLYFKGNWHTHPQNIPSPSWIDLISWNKSLKKTKPGESKYVFFLIVGIKKIRVWAGNINTGEIKEMILI